MDRNDLQNNGQLDHHQFFSGYTSYLGHSYSVKITYKYSGFFSIGNFKEIKLI